MSSGSTPAKSVIAVTRAGSAPVVAESIIASPGFNSDKEVGISRSSIWPMSASPGELGASSVHFE